MAYQSARHRPPDPVEVPRRGGGRWLATQRYCRGGDRVPVLRRARRADRGEAAGRLRDRGRPAGRSPRGGAPAQARVDGAAGVRRAVSQEAELVRLRAENARLRRLLDLSPEQARPAQATQTGLFLDRPGPVTAASSGADKVRFFRRLFAARTDVYATRWENRRTGRSGWVPAVEGGW